MLAVEAASASRTEVFALLLTASGDVAGPNGLRFSLSPDGERILLATSVPEEIDEVGFALVLRALLVRAEGWRTLLSAPHRAEPEFHDDPASFIRI